MPKHFFKLKIEFPFTHTGCPKISSHFYKLFRFYVFFVSHLFFIIYKHKLTLFQQFLMELSSNWFAPAINKAVDDWIRRLNDVIKANGGHFE